MNRKKHPSALSWKDITNLNDLDQALSLSFQRPVAIFKHSNRCGTSFMAKDRLESEWDMDPRQLEIFHVDVIGDRPVSNAITNKLSVPHQSPQIILLRNGEVVYHTSHLSIRLSALKKHLQAA